MNLGEIPSFTNSDHSTITIITSVVREWSPDSEIWSILKPFIRKLKKPDWETNWFHSWKLQTPLVKRFLLSSTSHWQPGCGEIPFSRQGTHDSIQSHVQVEIWTVRCSVLLDGKIIEYKNSFDCIVSLVKVKLHLSQNFGYLANPWNKRMPCPNDF